MKNKRSSRGSQTERVFARRSEILEMLDRRARVQSIKDDLGFGDMPRSTFNRLVSMIREEDRNKSTFANATSTQSEPVKPASKLAENFQPEREYAKKSDDSALRKFRPRKRKPVHPAEEETKGEYTGFDPSKWPDIEI